MSTPLLIPELIAIMARMQTTAERRLQAVVFPDSDEQLGVTMDDLIVNARHVLNPKPYSALIFCAECGSDRTFVRVSAEDQGLNPDTAYCCEVLI